MSIVARLHCLKLRLFGYPWEDWPDPPHDRHLTQLAPYDEVEVDRHTTHMVAVVPLVELLAENPLRFARP